MTDQNDTVKTKLSMCLTK